MVLFSLICRLAVSGCGWARRGRLTSEGATLFRPTFRWCGGDSGGALSAVLC